MRPVFAVPNVVSCPLCASEQTSLLHTGDKGSGRREFFHCFECDMVFVPRNRILPPEAQKARYLEHNNEVDDPAYRDFLARLYGPMKPHLRKGSTGLDYGAGPGPALAAMMGEDGHEISIYDPFFQPDEGVLEGAYDFITCTETAEHFSEPARDFQRLDGLLKPGGWLGLMTGMLMDWSEFPSWYYHRDPTHVNFYSRKTMSWIASRYGWRALFPVQNVALFHKSTTRT